MKYLHRQRSWLEVLKYDFECAAAHVVEYLTGEQVSEAKAAQDCFDGRFAGGRNQARLNPDVSGSPGLDELPG